MADHRATTVMLAVQTVLTGLSGSGDNVTLERDHAWPESVVEAIEIEEGADTPLESPWAYINSELSFTVTIIYKGASTEAATTLAALRTEVTKALMAWAITGASPIGLAFCYNLIEGPAGDIETRGDGEWPVFRRRLEWRVHYRRSRTDPTT